MLPTLFSAMFATYAVGAVNVYVSSKNGGDKSVINVNSAFWSAELYALVNNSQVSHVNLFLHQGQDAQGQDQWAPSIDLKSTDPATIKQRDAVVYLSTRGEKDFKVSMGALKECIARWSRAAKAAQLRRCSEAPRG